MNRKKAPSHKLLIILIVVLSVVVAGLAAVLLWLGNGSDNGQDSQTPETPEIVGDGNEEISEDPGIPLVTKYIVLSYPTELADLVSISYEEIPDGQLIIFTTDFTGETLELFRFSISKSGTDGHLLGVLKDETAGELLVCVEVKTYNSGNWTPEVYAQLNAMQERVNDIIVQFHEDPRFAPA